MRKDPQKTMGKTTYKQDHPGRILLSVSSGPYAEKAIQSLEDPSIFGEPPRIFHRENTPPGVKVCLVLIPLPDVLSGDVIGGFKD